MIEERLDESAISEEELAILEEIALLETERAHGRCGLPALRLAALATALAQPALDAYVTARVNGLCEEGATEVFRDVLATALRTGLGPTG